MTTVVDLFFAGIWGMVWHWGLGIGLIILCAFGAWFSPLYKKDFIYAGIIVIVALCCEAIGIHDEKAHIAAQQQALVDAVNKVVNSTTTMKSQKAKDPYDNRNN